MSGRPPARTPGRGRYSHDEVERRFLLAGRPAGLCEPRTISDRYLDGTTLRLRRVVHSGGEVHKLTQKVRAVPEDPTRVRITNTYLTAEEHGLLAGLPGADLEKTRWLWPGAGPGVVVDVFGGALAGLVLAEVEVAAEALEGPSLQHPCVVREVTRDDRYSGGALARAAGVPG